jgi:hypothetical protein
MPWKETTAMEQKIEYLRKNTPDGELKKSGG